VFGALSTKPLSVAVFVRVLPVPEVWLIYAVENEIRKRDRKNEIFFFPAEERIVLELVDIRARRRIA